MQSTVTLTGGMLIGDFPTGSASVGDRILNVQDYGADPSGAKDSADGIQRCLNDAFGPPDAPHGNGEGYKNSPVYVPRGNYACHKSLLLTSVWGGKLFGDGMLCSNIAYVGPLEPISDEGWIPTLRLNGCNYTKIAGLSFNGPADPNGKTVCLWWGPDGVITSSAHGNLIEQVSTGGQASYGIIHGSKGSAANSENTYFNCTLFGKHKVGLFCSGANSLNFRYLGGAIDSCDIGIETNNSATVPTIQNVAFANNWLDIDLAATSPAVLSGLRSESGQLLRCNSAVTLQNCWMTAPGDTFTGSIDGNVLTVIGLGSRGATVYPPAMLAGGGLDALYNSQQPYQGITRIVKQIDGDRGGIGTYEISRPALVEVTGLRIVPVFAELVGAASAVFDSCGSDNNQCILGDNNSAMHVRNNQWFCSNYGAIAPDLISHFSGQIFEYDIASRGEFIAAHLPRPSRALRGVRMFVHDAVDDSPGMELTGGGGKTAPIWCNGSAWKVG